MTDQPLDPLDRTILDLLQEEGAEVLIEFAPLVGRLIKVASKVKRFGNGRNPFEPDAKPNFELLQDEVGDFEALVDILIERGVLTREGIDARKVWKRGMLREHKTLPDAAFLPPVSVPSPLDDFPPGNPVVQAAKAARNGGYVALFGGHAPSAFPDYDLPPLEIRRAVPDEPGFHSTTDGVTVERFDVRPPSPAVTGKDLYEAYYTKARVADHLPSWDDLPPDNQRLWDEAAKKGLTKPESRGKALYTRYCDTQGIHSNRFPGWSELSAENQRLWDEAAKAGVNL
ncbi:hypothetical protein D869_gp034 [Caulobacter phage CcrRogue]|uniref:Uncharacterized protein n=1 Tax=Caulobacter phage CcrRogue TaxID=2927986 RepID=K4JNE1_9CAUD|nr:hypothetical protein D869_gp034 [Caulobacter phage CcrRogue]AFU86516.1 hypothetical protein CcrRogue_gp034 [Caulobacter phage CcrRogue]